MNDLGAENRTQFLEYVKDLVTRAKKDGLGLPDAEKEFLWSLAKAVYQLPEMSADRWRSRDDFVAVYPKLDVTPTVKKWPDIFEFRWNSGTHSLYVRLMLQVVRAITGELAASFDEVALVESRYIADAMKVKADSLCVRLG